MEDAFELRVPRLQVVRDRARNKRSDVSSSGDGRRPPDTSHTISEEKKVLRKEILLWWQCVAEQIDRLVRLPL